MRPSWRCCDVIPGSHEPVKTDNIPESMQLVVVNLAASGVDEDYLFIVSEGNKIYGVFIIMHPEKRRKKAESLY